VFTDKDGNIINDYKDEDDNTLEITGVDTTITGVGVDTITTETDTNTSDTVETTGVDNNNYAEHTTEVGSNTTGVHNTTGVQNNEHSIVPDTDNELNLTEDSQNGDYEQYDDDISIEDKTPEDVHITISDINTVHEMNYGQLYVEPDTGEAMEEEIDTRKHGYNLRPRPTKRNQKYNMISIGQQSTIAKPHLHVMLNQVGIREGIRKFGEKGNDALLKEFNQLH